MRVPPRNVGGFKRGKKAIIANSPAQIEHKSTSTILIWSLPGISLSLEIAFTHAITHVEAIASRTAFFASANFKKSITRCKVAVKYFFERFIRFVYIIHDDFSYEIAL